MCASWRTCSDVAFAQPSFVLHSDASEITNIHQAAICCTLCDVIRRGGKVTNDRTMTTLGRSEHQCQVFSYEMIHDKIAAGRSFLENKSCEILFSPHNKGYQLSQMF